MDRRIGAPLLRRSAASPDLTHVPSAALTTTIMSWLKERDPIPVGYWGPVYVPY